MLSSRVFVSTRSFAAAATSTDLNVVGKKKGGAALIQPIKISTPLQSFLGVTEISRGQLIKKIWEYVKENNLQKPEDKRIIKCDKKLKTIFVGKDEVGMFEMSKLLNAHFINKAN